MIGAAPSVLVVHPSLGVSNIDELKTYLRFLGQASRIWLARPRHR
jgi:hypothetical protein